MSDDQPIEAEVVPSHSQAVAVRQAGALVQPTIADLEAAFAMAVRQRELLEDYIRKKLQAGKHFYKREGDQKPSLNKEGAEIILLPHGLAADYDILSGPEEPPEGNRPYQITVKCILRKKGQPDSFEGSALGSAGSLKWTKSGGYVPRQKDRYLCHNATMKMAQKSALIAATLNSTAASEFFTQDLEPGEEGAGQAQGRDLHSRSRRGATPRGAASTPASGNAAPGRPTGKTVPFATADSRGRLLRKFENLDRAKEFFVALNWILPKGETAEDLPLQFVPVSGKQADRLMAAFKAWEEGKPAVAPYGPNPIAPEAPQGQPPAAAAPKQEPQGKPAEPDYRKKDPLWWRDIICPIPHKGEKKDQYMKRPDTVGSMYDARHDEEVARRLFGFMEHFEVETTWTTREGEVRDRSHDQIQQDTIFREALDACADYHEKHGDDTEPGPAEQLTPEQEQWVNDIPF